MAYFFLIVESERDPTAQRAGSPEGSCKIHQPKVDGSLGARLDGPN